MPIIRNLRKDFDEGRMDSLRSLKYEDSGVKAPYVPKPIGSTSDQISKRIDDASRIAEMLIDKPGLKHLANEALLKQGELTKKLEGNNGSLVGNIIRRAGGTIKHVAQVAGSTLAQVPVNGTGTHFLRAFRTDTYLQDGDPVSGFASFFGAGGVEGSKYALRGERVPSQGLLSTSILPDRNTTATPGELGGENHIGISYRLSGLDDRVTTYSNDNPFYQFTERTLTGIRNKGIIFANFESGLKVVDNTTVVPYQLGVNKSKTGASLAADSVAESNPNTLANKYSPTNSTEFLGSDSKRNRLLAQRGYPINPGALINSFQLNGVTSPDLFLPSSFTTAVSGSFGVTNKDVDFNISSIDQKFATVFEIGNKKTKFTTPENILAASSQIKVIPLKKEGNETTSAILESQPNDFDSGDIVGTNVISPNRYSDIAASLSYTNTLTKDNISAVQSQNNAKNASGIIGGKTAINADKQEVSKTSIEIGTTGSYNGIISSLGSGKQLQDFRSDEAINEFKGAVTSSYSFDYNKTEINKETRVKLGNQGYKKSSNISYNDPTPDLAIDKLNSLDVASGSLDGITDNRDLIQLEFQVVTPDQTYYLAFRAFLDTFDDSFNGSWNTHKYLGRAENFYTYSGFERSINIGFKIAAATSAEMKPLYRKAATLASVTAPTYGDNGRFMRGSIAKVTVGDYIYEQPGIIESVQYTWQKDYPWEIAFQGPELEDKKGPQVLPHVLDVSLSFKVIHDFLPQTGINPFITNHKPISKNKATYVPLVTT